MQVIDRVELYYVKTPLPAPHAPSWIPGTIREHVSMCIVRFVTEDGIEGWSGFPAAGRERAGLGDLLAGLFLGQDAEDIDTMAERIQIMAAGGKLAASAKSSFSAPAQAPGAPTAPSSSSGPRPSRSMTPGLVL